MKIPTQAFAAALTCAAAVASAQATEPGALVIDQPFAFETAATARAGAGYMSIENGGDAADRLVEVRADFPRVEIHTTEVTDGVASMKRVEAVEIPAGGRVAFEPGGLHVMFMGLDGDPFEVGEEVPATLVFEKAGEVPVNFEVAPRRDGG